jgi:cytochrome c oxidase cbb3-type subunit 2
MRSSAVMVLCLALLCGCRTTGSGAGRAPGDTRSKRLYLALCASCHGEDGRARAGEVEKLDPPAGDLTRCNFKYRSTASGTLPTDSDLLRTLHVGIPGTRMPSFSGAVRGPALEALVVEIKLRCRSFAEQDTAWREVVPAPGRAPGRLLAEAEARGRAVFAREQCSACHGPAGRGDGPTAAALKDVTGRPIRPRDFTRGLFRGGYALVDIYRAFSTGLDGTPMPALRDEVARADRWDLAIYLASLGRGRDGLRRPMLEPPFWYRRVLAWGAE